ncbi:hypothetical protein DQW50_07995 [Halorubrum sp. 48-1-W]|uniref:DUF5820 family protein n=1 Tax=Halorubrum sp. 48-1-W TaxID=2249761 RepID=UPI000DCC8B49|nr:DUF5820 family protein [Halorubrum sp. 48-1-W]RAW45679.1 hypothetical protein DQW50_07995 [Halorubrum sp. 48-1-W]
MSFEALPDGWRVWNEEPSGRAILVYRPDVFDGEDVPPECLPTIYLTNGARNARPGSGQYATDEWHVVLFLEPEIEAVAETHGSREAGADAAVDVAERFAAGEIDYRAAYQVPREAYFERLDELVGGG